MTFTPDEKKLLKYFVEQHLKEIKLNEKLRNQWPLDIAAEAGYENFLKGILKKL